MHLLNRMLIISMCKASLGFEYGSLLAIVTTNLPIVEVEEMASTPVGISAFFKKLR